MFAIDKEGNFTYFTMVDRAGNNIWTKLYFIENTNSKLYLFKIRFFVHSIDFYYYTASIYDRGYYDN